VGLEESRGIVTGCAFSGGSVMAEPVEVSLIAGCAAALSNDRMENRIIKPRRPASIDIDLNLDPDINNI
jgi:hypothetical protein